MTPYFSIIGDMHGEREVYQTLIRDVPYTVQIGDMDHDYGWMAIAGVDKGRHRFLGGNHDNYDEAPLSPYYLGDFGVHTIPECGDIFFVRGAWSIDYRARRAMPQYTRGKVLPKNYWPDMEELSMEKAQAALDLYRQLNPKFVIAHECPLSVVPWVTDPMFAHNMGYSQTVIKTRTNQLLQAMVEAHRPQVFVFGHYHRDFDEVIGGVRYICANICRRVDFEKDFLQKLLS